MRPCTTFPVSTRADNLSGKIFVGHSVKGGGQWSGSVARLAIFEGTFDTAEISRRYGGAAYQFVTPAGDFVSNVGETGPDLSIPKTFRLSKPKVLEWTDHLDRSVAVDA